MAARGPKSTHKFNSNKGSPANWCLLKSYNHQMLDTAKLRLGRFKNVVDTSLVMSTLLWPKAFPNRFPTGSGHERYQNELLPFCYPTR